MSILWTEFGNCNFGISDIAKNEWKEFAQENEILGISTYSPPTPIVNRFSCQDVGLSCDTYRGKIWRAIFNYVLIGFIS